MIRKTLITTIIAIAITTMVSGQETWDLERCMLYALENTPDIKRRLLRTTIYLSNTAMPSWISYLKSKAG